MKFAHIADCHLGSWRQPEMQALNLDAFEKTIHKCISEKVDFVIIAGDLFDTALPSIDILKSVVSVLRELKEKNIPCYIIPGSHDYSLSGKNMISVLDKAGLCIDLSQKSIVDNNKKIFIAGLHGKKGSLEQQEIIEMKTKLENEISSLKNKDKDYIGILLLHTSIAELLPKNLLDKIKALSIKDLPSNFDYYALGHIHNQKILETESKVFAYTGSLFPTSFSELEKQHTINFFIVEKRESKEKREEKEDLSDGESEKERQSNKSGEFSKFDINKVSLKSKEVLNIKIDANDKDPITLKREVEDLIDKISNEYKLSDSINGINGKIITLRIEGTLKQGKPSDLDLASIEEKIRKLGAYSFIRNSSKFNSKEFELKIDEIPESENIEELEKVSLSAAVKEGIINSNDKDLFINLLEILDREKMEGEREVDFELSLVRDVIKKFDLENLWK